jgi:hypothetical protein
MGILKSSLSKKLNRLKINLYQLSKQGSRFVYTSDVGLTIMLSDAILEEHFLSPKIAATQEPV